MFHVSTMLPYTPNNKQQVNMENMEIVCSILFCQENVFLCRQMLHINFQECRGFKALQTEPCSALIKLFVSTYKKQNVPHVCVLSQNFSQISVSVSIIFVVLPAAEEAPHWERHCDHCVPGTGSSPFHAQSHSVSLSACLHHCSGAQPLLWQHMLQVGPSGRLLGDKLRVDLHPSDFLICLYQYLK